MNIHLELILLEDHYQVMVTAVLLVQILLLVYMEL